MHRNAQLDVKTDAQSSRNVQRDTLSRPETLSTVRETPRDVQISKDSQRRAKMSRLQQTRRLTFHPPGISIE